MNAAAPVVSCRQLSKRYGAHTALHPLDLDIPAGEVFGFLGPNGAGKTTFIRLILGLAAPTSGEVALFGEDLVLHRRRLLRAVGAVVEAPVFFEYLTALENLTSLVSLSGRVDRAQIMETLRQVGLHEVARRPVGTFSYGMKQRLGIAQALLPATRFLVLDEPTNGLDPHGIAGMRELVRRLAREMGLTIFISSHLLAEVEQVCDRVVIINHGRRVLEGRVAELLNHAGEVAVRLRPQPDLAVRLAALPAPFAPTAPEPADDGTPQVRFTLATDQVPDLVRALVAAGLDVQQVAPHERTLEDIFIEATRSEVRDVRADRIRA